MPTPIRPPGGELSASRSERGANGVPGVADGGDGARGNGGRLAPGILRRRDRARIPGAKSLPRRRKEGARTQDHVGLVGGVRLRGGGPEEGGERISIRALKTRHCILYLNDKSIGVRFRVKNPDPQKA
jgi:hypothetical protein